MIKKSRKKLKYLENGKSFQDEIKSIVYHFERALIKARKTLFLEGEGPTLRKVVAIYTTKKLVLSKR